METFIQRSSDLLSIVNKLKKNSTEINYDDDFEALAHDFIQSRMKDLLDWYVRILEHCDSKLISEIMSFFDPFSDIFTSVLTFLARLKLVKPAKLSSTTVFPKQNIF